MQKRLALIFAFLGTIACSTTSEPTGSSTQPVNSRVRVTVPQDGNNAANECTGVNDPATCSNCCADAHATGVEDLNVAYVACACSGAGTPDGEPPCAKACGSTVCAATPTNPDDTCAACLEEVVADQSGACYNAVVEACNGSPECVAWQNCLSESCGL
jgi:hypothetical protein